MSRYTEVSDAGGGVRIVVAHNAYQQRGGEDSVVEAEAALLASRGHAVERFLRHNDAIADMSRLDAAVQTVWSAPAARDFEAVLRAFRPDVVHVHNTFLLMSPAIYWVANRLRVPVVQTLHNFRLLCPSAMFLREGKVCEDCLGRLPWRGATRACYRGSRPASAALAGMLTVHRLAGTWRNKVTRYIALNEFCRDKFVTGGLPAERIVVKPNFVELEPPAERDRSGFVFVGRLSAEKGVEVLLDGLARAGGLGLKVIGSGPEVSRFEGRDGVEMLGSLERKDVCAQMSGALALVFPSIWYETFGLVIVEAFASGTPIIGSRLGVVPGLVEDGVTGLLFNPGDASDLAEKLRWAQAHPAEMAAMGRAARARYEALYTADRNYAQLMKIYQEAIQEVQKGEAP